MMSTSRTIGQQSSSSWLVSIAILALIALSALLSSWHYYFVEKGHAVTPTKTATSSVDGKGKVASDLSLRQAAPAVKLENRTDLQEVSVPEFNGTGVVIFYHIPKTGGTTLRKLFMNGEKEHSCARRSYSSHEYVRPCAGEWDSVIPRVDRILRGDKQELLFVEIHGEGFMIGRHHENIQKWKELSKESNVPFFTFTLLREPISWYISYFLFFHNKDCKEPWCAKDTYEDLNEDNLIKSSVPDHQARYLVCHHKWCPDGAFETDLGYVDSDWTAFPTESLGDTAPLLVQNILGQQLEDKHNDNHNKKLIKQSGLTTKTLSNNTRAVLTAISAIDGALHKTAEERLRKWKP